MTAKHIFDLCLSLSMYLVLFISFYGWGYFVSFLLNLKFSAAKNYFSHIWLGFAFCLFSTQLLHFWVPIGANLSMGLFLGGASSFIIFSFVKGAVLRQRSIKTHNPEGWYIESKWLYLYAVLLALYAIWIASHAMLLPNSTR